MKKLFSILAMLTLAAGCQTPKPATTAASPYEAAQDVLQNRIATLGQSVRETQRTLDSQMKSQEQTKARLAAAYGELFETAKTVKAIKDRIDALQAAQKTGDTTIAGLQEKLKDASIQLKQIDSQLAGTPAQVSDLQKQLEKEKQQHELAMELAKQREKEIADLRRALATQQNLLKDTRKVVEADKTQPPAEAQPSGAGSHEDANQWVAQANNLLTAGKAEDAQKLFEAALKARPAMVTALVGLAACQYALGDYLSAANTTDRALDIDERNAQALGVKGLIYRKSGSLSSASSALEKAVKYDPQDARLHNYFGIVLNDRKRSAEAVEQFTKAVEIDPGYSEAHFNLAFLLATAAPPRLTEARQHYQTAVTLGADRDAELDKLLGKAEGEKQ